MTNVEATSLKSNTLTTGDGAITMSTSVGGITISPATGSSVLLDGTVQVADSKIGYVTDTDLITLADDLVTVAGEVSITTLDIGGTDVTSNASELN